MNKWELTRYLIDAKKVVDSIYFISDNSNCLRNLGLYEIIEGKRTLFYIYLCALLDKIFKGGRKKDLCIKDHVINQIYYHRDKHYAHKDTEYKKDNYNQIFEIAETMKKQIIHVRDVCANGLPKEVTLDFVSHDKVLFRHLHNITPEKEEDIKRSKHPLYKNPINKEDAGSSFKIFQDTEDIRQINEKQKGEYAVIIESGICISEDLQNRQDGCIRLNVLYNTNIWCTLNFQ